MCRAVIRQRPNSACMLRDYTWDVVGADASSQVPEEIGETGGNTTTKTSTTTISHAHSFIVFAGDVCRRTEACIYANTNRYIHQQYASDASTLLHIHFTTLNEPNEIPPC